MRAIVPLALRRAVIDGTRRQIVVPASRLIAVGVVQLDHFGASRTQVWVRWINARWSKFDLVKSTGEWSSDAARG
jgi:hypothetical protein